MLFNNFHRIGGIRMDFKKITVFTAAVLMVVLVIIAVFRSGGAGGTKPSDDPTDPAAVTEDPSAIPTAHTVDVSYLAQGSRYPCGCEAVSSVMALNDAGIAIGADTFIDTYLPQGEAPYYGSDGRLYGDSPYEVFLGSPYDESSFGCYAPVIKKALEQVIAASGGSQRVVDLGGNTLGQLCDEYVSRDIPVIVWGTIGMKPVSNRTTWILPDGSEFTWKSREHCLLLVGYDGEYYYFNDPMEGKNTAYRKADAESAYKELYSQALAIVNN